MFGSLSRSILFSALGGILATIIGCTAPDVKIGLLAMEMPAPVLKTGGVENVDFPDAQKYLSFGGSCDLRTKTLKVGFKKKDIADVNYDSVPFVSNYFANPGDPYTTSQSNDVDCSDGTFLFILSLDFILSMAEVANADELKNLEIEAIYITGETLIGNTKPMILPVGGDGDGPNQNPATKLVLRKFNPWNAASKYQCFEVKLDFLDSNNLPGYVPYEGNYKIVDGNSAAIVSYPSINDCNSAINGSENFPIPEGNSHVVRALKFNDLGTQTVQLSYVSGHSFDVSSSAIDLNIRDGTAGAYRYLSFDYKTPRAIARGACYEASVGLHLGNTSPDSGVDRTAVTVNFSSTNSGMKFYNDASCTNQISSTTILAGGWFSNFWIAFPGSGTITEQFLYNQISASANGTLTSGSTPLVIDENRAFVYIDDTASNSIQRISLGIPQNMMVSACYGLHIETTNKNGTPIPVPAGGLNLNWSSNASFSIYSGYNCSSTAITQSFMNAGVYKTDLSIKGFSAVTTNNWFISTILNGTTIESYKPTFTFAY